MFQLNIQMVMFQQKQVFAMDVVGLGAYRKLGIDLKPSSFGRYEQIFNKYPKPKKWGLKLLTPILITDVFQTWKYSFERKRKN